MQGGDFTLRNGKGGGEQRWFAFGEGPANSSLLQSPSTAGRSMTRTSSARLTPKGEVYSALLRGRADPPSLCSLLVMANRGKNTNGSQFFVSLRPCPHLNGKHVVMGRVVKGELGAEGARRRKLTQIFKRLRHHRGTQQASRQREGSPRAAGHHLALR